MTGRTRDEIGRRRRTVALVDATILIDTILFAALTPLLPYYGDRFAASTATLGILAGAYAAGTVLGSVPCGWLAARVGARTIVWTGLAVVAASGVGVALGSNVEMLIAARFVQGLGGACCWIGSMGWLLTVMPAAARGRAIGHTMGVAVAGGLLGPALGAVALLTGPALPFGTVAVLAAAVGVAALVLDAPTSAVETPGALSTALRHRVVLTGMVLVTVPAVVLGAVNVLAPLRLDTLGASGLVIGATFVVAAATESVGQNLIGRMIDRVGRRPPVLAGLGVAGVILLLVPLPTEVLLLAGVVVVTIVVVGVLYTPAMALLSDGAEQVGLDQTVAFAVVNVTWAGGQMLGAMAGGGLDGLTADAVPYAVLAALCIATLAGAVPRRLWSKENR